MGRNIPPGDLEKAVTLYLAGQSIKQASSVVGINGKSLARELRHRGVPPGRRLLEIPTAVEEYLSGDSVLAIATRHGVERGVIDRHLREAGVQKRTASEQNRISAGRESEKERLERVSKAHAAKRGKPNSPESRCAAARTREAKASPQSRAERQMLDWLKEADEHPRIQVAVESYNLDVAIYPIAVELLGGEWHRYKRTHAVRTKAILDAGWHVLFVWDTPMFPIERASADYAIAFAEEARSDPSGLREYRVIRGDGEFVSGGSLKDYDLTAIPTARHGMSPSEVGRLGAATRWGKR